MIREKCYLNCKPNGVMQKMHEGRSGDGGKIGRPLNSRQEEHTCEVPEGSKEIAKP